MTVNSTSQRPCAVCDRDLGYVMRTLVVTYDGRRYEVCGHTMTCAERLMKRLSKGVVTTTSTTDDTVRAFGMTEVRRWS